jgi:CspA family cold shock protein
MKTGTVKFFNKEKGYGFITSDETGEDVFVHVSQVNTKRPIKDGDAVKFGMGKSKKGECAECVELL